VVSCVDSSIGGKQPLVAEWLPREQKIDANKLTYPFLGFLMCWRNVRGCYSENKPWCQINWIEEEGKGGSESHHLIQSLGLGCLLEDLTEDEKMVLACIPLVRHNIHIRHTKVTGVELLDLHLAQQMGTQKMSFSADMDQSWNLSLLGFA